MNRGDRRVVREVHEWTDEFGSHREDVYDIEEFWDGKRWRRGRTSRRAQQDQAGQAEEHARREAAEQQRRHRRNLLLLHRH